MEIIVMESSQKDFLGEVLNIGMGRAASCIGELVQSRVTLSVPLVTISSIDNLARNFEVFGIDNIVSIRMGFSGILSGDALLLLSKYSSMLLTRSVMQNANLEELSCAQEEVLVEVGNIVLNSAVGSWADLFQDHFKFTIPEYRELTVPVLLETWAARNEQKDSALKAVCADAYFEIQDFFIIGTIIILFDKNSVEKVIGAVSA